jgi:hypothetical protein
MVNVLILSMVDHCFEPKSGQTKDYKITICCSSSKHAVLMNKSKPIYLFDPVTFMCLSEVPGFQTSYVIIFLCSISWGKRWLSVLLILVEYLTITV